MHFYEGESREQRSYSTRMNGIWIGLKYTRQHCSKIFFIWGSLFLSRSRRCMSPCLCVPLSSWWLSFCTYASFQWSRFPNARYCCKSLATALRFLHRSTLLTLSTAFSLAHRLCCLHRELSTRYIEGRVEAIHQSWSCLTFQMENL